MSEFDLLSMFPNIEREDIFNLSETEIIRTLKENGYNEQFKDSSVPKTGRNEKCPCGSGKKFKHCHGNI